LPKILGILQLPIKTYIYIENRYRENSLKDEEKENERGNGAL
jgi:hypothetical protein